MNGKCHNKTLQREGKVMFVYKTQCIREKNGAGKVLFGLKRNE